MGKETRIDYIDYAKAIGIILVVIGHINEYNSPCKAWLYAFHMPLFFILSGMFLKPSNDFRAFIDKRVRRLIVPFLIWGLIFAEFSFKNLLCVCYGSHQTLYIAHSLSSLWFFTVLFVAYIMAELVINRCKGSAILPKLLWGGVGMAVGFLLPKIKHGYPWGVNIAFVAFGFMMVGKCVFDLFLRVREMNNTRLILTTCVLCLMTLGAMCNIPSSGYINMANAEYGNPFLFLLFALVGSAFVLSVSILIERVKMGRANKWLLYVGQNSLTIMILHKPIISLCVKLMLRVELPYSVCLLIVTFVTLLLCCVGIWLLNRYVPQIVGRNENSN